MTGSNIIKDLMEFKEFLGKLKDCMIELNNYCDKSSGIDADIAGEIEIIIREDIINDKREHSDKVKSVVRLYYIADFVYGLIFYKDEFHGLLVIVRKIMELVEDYEFLND